MNETDRYADGEASTPTRILDAAEALFMQYGFGPVSLRQVAQGANIRQATLYHYFPQGKESLYIAVLEREFTRRNRGLEQAIRGAESGLASRLNAVFRWLGEQPEIHHMGMMYADLPALKPENAARVSQIVYDALFQPLVKLFGEAIARGEMRATSPEFLAGAVIALADGITFSMNQNHQIPRQVLEEEMARLMLDGLWRR